MELVEKCKKGCLLVGKELDNIEPYIIYGRPYDYRDLVKYAEGLALQVRELCSKTVPEESLNEYDRAKNEIIAKCSGITWTYINKDHFVLHMPALLKKNRFSSREFLRTEVLNVLYDLLERRDVSVGDGKYVVFDHLVNDRKRRCTPDYDNMDISTVINCLSETVIGNDSPFCYDLMHMSTAVDDKDFKNRADVHVMSKTEFVKFVVEKFVD